VNAYFEGNCETVKREKNGDKYYTSSKLIRVSFIEMSSEK